MGMSWGGRYGGAEDADCRLWKDRGVTTPTAARCKADGTLQMTSAKAGGHKRLSVGDCGRWMMDAHLVGCNETNSIVRQLMFLVNVLGG